MPVTKGDVIFHIGTPCSPASARHLIGETVIALLHHIIYPRPFISVIVIIRLPDGTVRIYCKLIVVSEIMAQHFNAGAIHLHAERHSLSERLAVGYYLASVNIDHGVAF